MFSSRRHRKQRFMSKLHEQFIKLCSVKATAARGIDFLHGFVTGKTAFVGCDADAWAIGAVERVDVDAFGAAEFMVDEVEGCEVCVERSREFGERRGEVSVEVVDNIEDGKKIDEKHDCSFYGSQLVRREKKFGMGL
jgi:hypothetical protein